MSTYRRQRGIKLKNIVKTTETGRIPFGLPTERFYVLVPAIAVADTYTINIQEQFMANRGYTPTQFSVDTLQTYTSNFAPRQETSIIEDDYNRRIVVYWDLGRMLDAYQSGYNITFTSHKESYRMYLLIEEYFDKIDQIRAMGHESLYEFDPRLMLLDEFNKNVFNNNSSFIKNKRASIITNARRNMLKNLGLNPNLMLDNKPSPIQYTPIKNPELDKPMSASEFRHNRRRRVTSIVDATPSPDGKSVFQPEFYDAPTIDFSKIRHRTRYIDPEERRLTKEHLDAKKRLEGQ